MKAPLSVRARAILARIDARVEQQTLREGSDALHCVATVGAYTRMAGDLESRIDEHARYGHKSLLARRLRILRNIARDHELMVLCSGITARNKRMDTVQRAITAAQRGKRFGILMLKLFGLYVACVLGGEFPWPGAL